MVEPVGLDRRVHRADLLGEAIGRDVQVAERHRDVPDLIAAGVGDAGRQLPGRQSPGCLGDLSQRPRDRPPQHEAQTGDEQEHAKRHSSLGAGAGLCRTEIRRRHRRQLTGGLAFQATQRADARPRHGQPPLRRHSPGDARRIPDHQLPYTLDRRVRRPGQQPVKLGDEGPGAVLAKRVERIGLHDDPAHAHQLRPTNERGGLRDPLHLGPLDRLHERHVGVRRPAGVARRPRGVQVADDADQTTDDSSVLLDDLVQAERSAGRLPAQRIESATRGIQPVRDVDRRMLARHQRGSSPQPRVDRAPSRGDPPAVGGGHAQPARHHRRALVRDRLGHARDRERQSCVGAELAQAVGLAPVVHRGQRREDDQAACRNHDEQRELRPDAHPRQDSDPGGGRRAPRYVPGNVHGSPCSGER
jgi:hypothetical protein